MINLDPDIKADLEPCAEALVDVIDYLRGIKTTADLSDVIRVLKIHTSALDSIRSRQVDRVISH